MSDIRSSNAVISVTGGEQYLSNIASKFYISKPLLSFNPACSLCMFHQIQPPHVSYNYVPNDTTK